MRTFVSVIGAGIGSALIITLFVRLSLKKRQSLSPNQQKWILIGKIKQITMFPVKSCHGLNLDSVECEMFGIKSKGFQDRRLVLLDDTDRMCFAGVYPQMLSIRSEITTKSIIRLSAPGLNSITLNIEELSNSEKVNVIKKQMKGYSLHLIECSTEHHRWFSQAVLGQEKGLRLFLSMDPILQQHSSWRQTKTDIMPFMVIHEKSVSDLNNRLTIGNRVHHQQFRDNFLIETEESVKAFDEDNWMWLRIGEDSVNCTILRYNSPCLRCILPNIDIFTCKRNADFEPLRTLKKFRLRSNNIEPEMGVYFDLFKAGLAEKGDNVYVQ